MNMVKQLLSQTTMNTFIYLVAVNQLRIFLKMLFLTLTENNWVG